MKSPFSRFLEVEKKEVDRLVRVKANHHEQIEQVEN